MRSLFPADSGRIGNAGEDHTRIISIDTASLFQASIRIYIIFLLSVNSDDTATGLALTPIVLKFSLDVRIGCVISERAAFHDGSISR